MSFEHHIANTTY